MSNFVANTEASSAEEAYFFKWVTIPAIFEIEEAG